MALNSATIIGNLGNDPDCRKMNDGTSVANLSIAVTDKWTDKASGQKRERTEWIRCALFGPVADIAQQYLRKGSKCCVVGRIQTRKWQDNSGQDRYTTEVVVDRMGKLVLLDSRSDSTSRGGYADHSRGEGGGGETGDGFDLDSEIPFAHPWGAL